MADDVMVINDYGLTRRTSTLKSGATKQRYYTVIKSEPVLISTDPKALTRATASAAADHLRQRVQDISAQASPATIKRRQVAAKALAEGKPWAVQRYSGGRTGTMAPNQSDKMFNDSGRFSRSIAVGGTKDGWAINVAANRLDPRTLDGGEAGLVKMVERLRQYVPEWGDASRLMEVLSVRRAMKDVGGEMIRKTKSETVDLMTRLMQSVMGRGVGEP